MGRQCRLKLQNENIACIFFKMICKYWNFLMLLFILSVKYGNGMPQSSISRPNVVNGIDASEPIPWQVSIRRNSEHICGGTILNENTVLSAAHCFFGFDYDNKILTTGKDNALQNNFTILAGIINREDSVSGQEIEVDGYIWPPMDYNPYSFTNDIIILKLKGNLVFSQKKVYAVSLPLEKTWGKYDSLEDCMISGWGCTTRHKSSQIPKILQWASVPTIANCNSVSNYTNLIESQICAGDLNNGKTDACTGDSGGPLVCKSGFSGYVMTGVVSYGPRICGTPDYPGIYTRVGYFLDWIKDNMEKPVTVDCDWTSWSDWSSCSQTCGAGVREKSRQVKTTAQNGGSPIDLRFGSPCSGSARQTESCNIQECPVNCQWSSWSETGPCSKSCGGGVQYFERVINVESQNGGQSCTGSRTKREYCNTQNCPCYCNIDNRCSCRRDRQKEKRLYDAAKHGHLATVKELIKTTYVDPTPEYGIEYGYTPLIWAAENGHKDIVQILLENGANIDHQEKIVGWTALILAAVSFEKDVVQLLLDRKANTKLKINDGDTACTWNDRVDNIIPSCN